MNKTFQQTTALIPAWNEAPRIKKILETVLKAKRVDQILVVDDGSTDETARVAEKFSEVKILKLKRNLGKTKAVLTAVLRITTPFTILLDADLIGLRAEDIDRTIYLSQQIEGMAILNYSNQQDILTKMLKSFPALSGVRCLPSADFKFFKPTGESTWELEPMINRYYLDANKPIAWLEAPGLFTPRKVEKYPGLYGQYLEIKALWELSFVRGPIGFLRNYRQWQSVYRHRVTDKISSEQPF